MIANAGRGHGVLISALIACLPAHRAERGTMTAKRLSHPPTGSRGTGSFGWRSCLLESRTSMDWPHVPDCCRAPQHLQRREQKQEILPQRGLRSGPCISTKGCERRWSAWRRGRHRYAYKIQPIDVYERIVLRPDVAISWSLWPVTCSPGFLSGRQRTTTPQPHSSATGRCAQCCH